MSEQDAVKDQERERFEAKHQVQPSRRIIATGVPNLRLVALAPADADAYYALVDCNRTHLTQHGDWKDLGEATPASVYADLVHLEDLYAYFGIWLGPSSGIFRFFQGVLVGIASDLIPYHPLPSLPVTLSVVAPGRDHRQSTPGPLQ
jgi:hypothetical protein